MTIKGSCLCGAVSFEVSAVEPHMAHCHCRMCRKFHGAAFSTFGAARTENFRWILGESYLSTYKAVNGTERQFCSNCGSSLIFKSAKQDDAQIEFALGCIDSGAGELQPDAHIYTSYKAPWYDICDNLPVYGEGRAE